MALVRKNAGDVITAAAANQQFYDLLTGVAAVAPVYLNYDLAGAYPTSNLQLCLGSNFSVGLSEVDVWNTTLAANTSFRFYQKTAAAAATLLMSMYATGGIYIGITPTDPGANSLAVRSALTAGSIATSGRLQEKQGAAIASANDLTLGSDGNVFTISGTTLINRISGTGWQDGCLVTLHFSSGLTIKNGIAAAPPLQTIYLNGNVDYAVAPNGTVTLRILNSTWVEVGRKV